MGGRKSKSQNANLYGEIDEEEIDNKKADGALPIRLKANQLRVFTTNPDKPGQSTESLEVLRYGLCLEPKIVNKFFSLFCAADTEDTGELNREQIYEFLEIQRTPFNDRLFGLFDFDESGDIDFVEFVCAIWNLCTWEKLQLPRLMFTLYSPVNGTMANWLDHKVVVQLLCDAFAARKIRTTIDLLLDSVAAIKEPGVIEGEERIYFTDFVEWVSNHPQAIQPVETMQRFLRNRMFGKAWWLSVGVETRDRVISQMEESYRDRFGNSGAHDAMTMAVHLAKEKRERSKEMKMKLRERRVRAMELAAAHHQKQLKGNPKLKNESERKAAIDSLEEKLAKLQEEDEEEVPGTPAIPFQVEMARDRVEAYREFSKKRTRKFKEWNMVKKELINERSPLSAMVQCQAPWLLDRMVEDLEVEWRIAGEELRTQTYKPPKRTPVTNREVYFQRKSPLDVQVGLAELDTQVLSVAHGERSFEAEQVHKQRMARGSLLGPLEDDDGCDSDPDDSLPDRPESKQRVGSGGSLLGHRPVSRQAEFAPSRLGQRDRQTLAALQDSTANGEPRNVTSFQARSDARYTLPSREEAKSRLESRASERRARPQSPLVTDPRGAFLGFTSKLPQENHKKVPEYHKKRMRILNKIQEAKIRFELVQNPVRISPT